MNHYNPLGFREMGRARLASALLNTLQVSADPIAGVLLIFYII